MSFISAVAGLTGAAIGGLTSFATSWFTQQTQMIDKHRQADWSKREHLYSAFIVEASRLYGDALTHQNDDVGNFVKLYALLARMRLVASRSVVRCAEKTIGVITEAYLQPNRSLSELRQLAGREGFNFLEDFSDSCRKELHVLSLRSGRRRTVDEH